ncbi:hypothetical protein KC216_22330, partial [Mycobacterium tuberculosis]|nr:hypothetical protein [Mycobacterium tuberculosis]
LSIKALFRRLFGRSAGLYSSARSAAARHNDDDLFADAPMARQNGARREPGFYDEAPRIEAPSIDIGNDGFGHEPDDYDP